MTALGGIILEARARLHFRLAFSISLPSATMPSFKYLSTFQIGPMIVNLSQEPIWQQFGTIDLITILSTIFQWAITLFPMMSIPFPKQRLFLSWHKAHTCNPSTLRLRQENKDKFQASWSCKRPCLNLKEILGGIRDGSQWESASLTGTKSWTRYSGTYLGSQHSRARRVRISKVSLGNLANSSPAWAEWDPFSENKFSFL